LLLLFKGPRKLDDAVGPALDAQELAVDQETLVIEKLCFD
jgi:hypothetical protein